MIRRALPEEAGMLSELAVSSKAHWGYDAEFLARCRDDLAISPESAAKSPVFVYEDAEGIAGFYMILPGGEVGELDSIFVDPRAIGMGVGNKLWEHAVATAAEMSCVALEFQSDPHAEGFYLAMGATRNGESRSTATPGRMLPLMRYRMK
jgi:GNAT superfamily N-acetyltransferase